MRDAEDAILDVVGLEVMIVKEDDIVFIRGAPREELGVRSLYADQDKRLYFISCSGPEDYRNLERESLRLARELAVAPGAMEALFGWMPGVVSQRKEMRQKLDQLIETMRARPDADNPNYWHIFTGKYNEVMKHARVISVENGSMPLERTMQFQLDGHTGFLYHPGHFLARNGLSPAFTYRGEVKSLCRRIVLRKD